MSDLAQTEQEIMIERIKSGIELAKSKNIHCGRPKGSKEDLGAFLAKYPKAIKDLKNGLSVRKVMKLHDLSNFTVMKIRKYLFLEIKSLSGK